jgi:hypothetical protein
MLQWITQRVSIRTGGILSGGMESKLWYAPEDPELRRLG